LAGADERGGAGKKRFFKKKFFWSLGALAPELPLIAPVGGDYRQSPSPRPQEQKFFGYFFSKK
jgi:hypothetical protein